MAHPHEQFVLLLLLTAACGSESVDADGAHQTEKRSGSAHFAVDVEPGVTQWKLPLDFPPSAKFLRVILEGQSADDPELRLVFGGNTYCWSRKPGGLEDCTLRARDWVGYSHWRGAWPPAKGHVSPSMPNAQPAEIWLELPEAGGLSGSILIFWTEDGATETRKVSGVEGEHERRYAIAVPRGAREINLFGRAGGRGTMELLVDGGDCSDAGYAPHCEVGETPLPELDVLVRGTFDGRYFLATEWAPADAPPIPSN